MSDDIQSLEPQILSILSAPGIDLSTISAKRVRKQLLAVDSSLTSEFLKDNKEALDLLIGRVFERVSSSQTFVTRDLESSEPPKGGSNEDEDDVGQEEYQKGEDEDEDEEVAPPPRKKAKRSSTHEELTDAELARKLSNEINSRSRRSADKTRGSTNGTPRKGAKPRQKKSAATVNSDDSEDDEVEGKKRSRPKKKANGGGGGGGAKGGFAKEYVLSAPLAAVLRVDKLSRPQVVKQLWDYIKGNELQNPANKREIMCDDGFRAVFNVDKIDMFRMNKVLGQHLHESEG